MYGVWFPATGDSAGVGSCESRTANGWRWILSEADLYPQVEAWVKRRFKCFATAINTGIRFGRIDVVGIRDIGGVFTGSTELISVEVKAGNQPYATAAGQAHGYSVYAERCYLADVRPGRAPYSDDELDIASRLDIGLLRISGNRVEEVMTAPSGSPVQRLQLQVVEKLGYAPCTVCGSLFKYGETPTDGKRLRRYTDAGTAVTKAIAEEKGFIYWLNDVAERSPEKSARSGIYHRRYVCADCVYGIFGSLEHEHD